MTEELFREDAYLTSCTATVVAVTDRGGIELDRTVFYPTGGGQPGDSGTLTLSDGSAISIATTLKDRETGQHLHIPGEGEALPEVGTTVEAAIDWETRHKYMRMHSAMHLLCALVDGGVTGGQVGTEKSRLDFDLPDTNVDKDALEAKLNALVEADHPTGAKWITDAELDENPDLVRTMSVAPPRGSGKVRLLEIKGVDLQPCGGTHVARTGEIGKLRVGKIENKGKHNRRINLHLVEQRTFLTQIAQQST